MATKVVLVTGGSGLVGTAVREYVLSSRPEEKWVFVGSKEVDLTNACSASALFNQIQPTHVLHLAAKVGGLFANMKQGVQFWRENMAMQDNIMLLSHQHNVKKVVSCLSTCIFPDKTAYPIDETTIHEGPPHHSNEGYAYAKRMVDVQNRLYHRQYGMACTSVIPTNIYGPHDNFSIEDGHVIPGLIHKCYLSATTGQPLTVAGSGSPMRQFIYSQDLAKLLVWVVEEYNEPEPVILSVDPSEEVSIHDVALEIAKCMGFSGEVVFDINQADGQLRKTASNVKLRSYLPSFCFTPLHQGIAETVTWFKAAYPNLRK